MDSEVIQEILQKNPLLQRQQDKLEAMTTGRYCFHRSFGFGIIRDYDRDLGKLIVDFDSRPNHAIDPAFALKHLQILPDDHLIAQYHREPEEILRRLNHEPSAIAQLILAHAPNQRATLADLNEVLTAILDEKSLKNWWTRARKAIEADPCIAIPSSKTGYYTLRETPLSSLDEAIDGFFDAKQMAQKLHFAAKILREKDIAAAGEKLGLVQEEVERLLALPTTGEMDYLQLHWLAEDLRTLANQLPEPSDEFAAFLSSIKNLNEVANGLPTAGLNRLLTSLNDLFPDNFLQIALGLIRNGSLKTIGLVVDYLLKLDQLSFLQENFNQWMRENGFRAALLEWTIRNRHSRKYRDLLANLINATLLRFALSAIDQEALRRSSNRKISLAETLAADHDLIAEILRSEPIGIAKDLAHMILFNQGFDLLTKKSILARFIRIFPSLQQLLESNSARKDAWISVSEESLEQIRREYDELVSEKIPANKKAIEAAREHGDLRENSEYKMARQDQDILLARRAKIEQDLEHIQVIDYQKVETDRVAIGTVVTLDIGKGRQRRLAILGAWDGDPQRNIIAYQTPLGQALLNRQPGDTVQLSGQPEMRVEKIERWIDCASAWQGK